MPTSIELFTGAGGLALGIHQAGFEHLAIAEWDKHSVETLRMNRGLLGLARIEVERTDVSKVDWTIYAGRVDLVAGGVPCQPFSLGGQHRGQADNRNLFPEMLRAVREIAPAAVLIENVKGLVRPSFAPYFRYVTHQLEFPEIGPRTGEDWWEHDQRLTRETLGYKRRGSLGYTVRPRLIQCANYGVPQQRERVFVVAYRSDLDLLWEPPPPTHSRRELLRQQYVTKTYWFEHGLTKRGAVQDLKAEIAEISGHPQPPDAARWRTVRDALRGLPKPVKRQFDQHNLLLLCEACHWGNPGARRYHGHEGSLMDWPAKTLKAGVHGVPGGENMLRNPNGTVRYFTAREAARLQTFPDDYHFPGSWGETFRQLGNAVPVSVARLIADQIAAAILESKSRETAEHPSLAASG